MEQNIKNKINATDESIKTLLKEQKFSIDYFQREYKWGQKQIAQLVNDLTSSFLQEYKNGDERKQVANYKSYFLGPVILYHDITKGVKSIIDGQQRITSLTLFLIYLNHLRKKYSKQISIEELIFSETYGDKSFNLSDPNRENCLYALFENGEYKVKETDDETVKNMVERYTDIDTEFPSEYITENNILHFLDWMQNNVIVVQIMAYSEDNSYTIFETMNDRGLSLTPTEMLKGFVLSKIEDKDKRLEIDTLWKEQIQKLHKHDDKTDQTFFQSWFRSKYAETMRERKAGTENEDFEIIGTKFHNWFKDNYKNRFNLRKSTDFYNFFKKDFVFYVDTYMRIKEGQSKYDNNIPHLRYVSPNSLCIADSLQDSLLLASINIGDSCDIISKKLDLVARYIETFVIKRKVNYKNYGLSVINYTIFDLIKKIRNNDINALGTNLIKKLNEMNEQWDEIVNLGLNGGNGKFIKHLLSRISGYIDFHMGKDSDYDSYYYPKGKTFEIEHIWGNTFHIDNKGFEQEIEFNSYRNKVGDLLLLPNGTNQSYSDKRYNIKIEHYIKENAYAQTLHKKFYENNPNFLNSDSIKTLGFHPHENFNKSDIDERTSLVKKICEQIWDTSYFINI